MAPSSNTRTRTLKQGTLGFTAKRSNSTANVAKDKLAPRTQSLPVKGSKTPRIDPLPVKERAPLSSDSTKASDQESEKQPASPPAPELDVNDSRWQTQHRMARHRANAKPIHGENQNKIHEILRVFDLSYEYGPCVGVTRLERWERANALGLNPPAEIRDILLTRQGKEETDLVQPVFYDAV